MSKHSTKKWQRKSKVIRKRDGYQCRQCRRYGRTVDADLVHHIFPADEHPEHFFNDDNLISLCTSCHELMHDRQTGQMTDLGRMWQEKVRRKVFK